MDGLNTPGVSETDAAWQKLIARYLEANVLLAARGLLDPGELPPGLQPIAVSATHPAADRPGSLRGLIQLLAGMGGSAPLRDTAVR
jgi:hypothetical protein